jgi:fructose-specific phosphotransferase system IIC component
MTFWELLNESTTLASKIGYDNSVDPIRNIVFHPIVGNVFYCLLILYYIGLVTSGFISAIFELEWFIKWKEDDYSFAIFSPLLFIGGITFLGFWQFILWIAMFIWPLWIFVSILFAIKYGIDKKVFSKKVKPLNTLKNDIDEYRNKLSSL